MIFRSMISLLVRALVFCVLAVPAWQLHAVNLYWDINGALPGATNNSDAPGFWNNNSWSTDISGGVETGPWAADSTAVFSAGGNATGPFSVNLSGPESVSDIIFEEGNVGIVGLSTLTLTGGEVRVASGLTASISAPIGGTAGLEKTGEGTLTVSGEGFAYSGNTIVAGGMLKLVGGTINNTGVMAAGDGTILELGVTSTAGHLIGGHLATSGSGLIDITSNYKLQGVTIDPGAHIETFDGITISLADTVTNNTVLEVRYSGVNYRGVAIDGNATLAGSGAVELTEAKIIGPGVLTNDVDHTIRGSGHFGWGSTTTFVNHGLIDANQPAALIVARSTVNTGTMRASNGGTLYVGNGTFTNTDGVITALDGSIVELGGSATFINGTLSTAGSGAIKVNGSSGFAPAILENVTLATGSLLQISGGNTLGLRGVLSNEGSFGPGTAAGGTSVIIDGDVTVTGNGVWEMTPNSSNTITAAVAGNTLINDVNHTIRGAGSIGHFGGLQLLNKGLIDVNHPNGMGIRTDPGGGATPSYTATNTGTMRARNGGLISFFRAYFINTGILEVLNGSTVSFDQFNSVLANSSAGTLTGGTYRSVDGGSGASILVTSSAPVSTIAADTTVELSGPGAVIRFGFTDLAASLSINAGTLRIMNGHSFSATANPLHNSGTLAGNGTVVGDVQNSGVVAPSTSSGTLTITVNYTQTSSGSLGIELTGATAGSFDSLSISGTATLDGTVDVSLLGGYIPEANDMFTILTASNVNNANGLVLSASDEPYYDLIFTPTSVVLSVVAVPPLSGDFDNDGDVDGRDSLIWQRGGSPSPLSAGDLARWRANYGTGSLGTSQAVPEPGSIALQLILAFVTLGRSLLFQTPSNARSPR